jgi:hypothetical protein
VVAYRSGQFVFAGMDYSEYDAFQEYGPMNCSFNTLTGRKNYLNKAGVMVNWVAISNQNFVRKAIDDLNESDVIGLASEECQPN